jgi:glutamine amidotransferase
MIGVIDYGLGNMFSLENALKYIGAKFRVIRAPEETRAVDALILPGVGAFPEGMKKLGAKGMDETVKAWQKPLLGICLGMQLLFSESEEFTSTKGLCLLPGRVVKIEGSVKVPHMGWNRLDIRFETPLTKGFPKNANAYFVHSFKAEAGADIVAASVDYDQEITAIAARGNVFGTQFHPEKSGDAGLLILENFARLSKSI